MSFSPRDAPPLKPWRDPPLQLESAPPRFGNPPMSQPAEPLVLVVRKTQASAFFGTHLGSVLTGRAIDTLIVTGCTTSGCARASVVDAVSMNFRTVVASDAVGDRAHGPHEANLFDMGQKYADLLSVGEIMAALRPHPESVMAGAKSA